MPDILLRDLDDETVARLTERARRNQRSLEAELKVIFENAVANEPTAAGREEFWRIADDVRERLKGRRHTDSAQIIRESRDQ